MAASVVRHFLATHAPLAGYDEDDLLQECLLHWSQQRGRYQPERGASRETYLRRVVETKLIDVERRVQADKRDRGRRPLSLDVPAVTDGEEVLGDLLPSSDQVERSALMQVALHSAATRLTERQRDMVVRLHAGETMAEVSRALGMARATLYGELARIRQVFFDEGLDEFLR